VPRITRRTFWLALAAAGVLSSSTRAADDKTLARDHFKLGQTHYALGEFAEAVTEFREAYRLQREPVILFNMAQAMRQSGQFTQAYFYYAQYLSLRPDAPNRNEVKSFMATMKQKANASDEADKARGEADTVRPGPATYPADHPDDGQEDKPREVAQLGNPLNTVAATTTPVPSAAATAPKAPAVSAAATQTAQAAPLNKLHVAAYVVAGTGLAVGGLAFLFHSSAQTAADQFNQRYSSGTLTAADAQLKSTAQSKGSLATLSLVGAGVLLATGSVLFFAF
jgi:tetratricopeptide (TPR) repeat protein